MAVNFQELLDYDSKTVTRPRSAPVCWLTADIGAVEFGVIPNENETPWSSFQLLNVEPHPDTDPELLEGVNLKTLRSPYRKTLAVDYWLTEDSKHLLSDMLDRVIGDPERKVKERIPETRGVRVKFKVAPHKNRDNDDDTGQNIVDGRTVCLAD